MSRLVILFAIATIPLFSAQLLAQKTPAETKPAAAKTDATPADAKLDLGSAPDQEAIDNLKTFLEGSKWNGTFTVKGKGEKLHVEEYEISEAEKDEGDQWLLLVRIRYMGKDRSATIPVNFHWINRTPVIVIDSLTIPGMGTFDARVIIRKGMYAGTWAHGKVGGHMFGDIKTKAQLAEAEARKAEKEQPAASK